MSKAGDILNKTNEAVGKVTKVKVKVPSFTFSCDLGVRDRTETFGIKQPVEVEIDTFENDLEKVLDKVVSKTIADVVNSKKLSKAGVTDRNVYVGGHNCSFPKSFYFEYK